jgi:hypothetical protein
MTMLTKDQIDFLLSQKIHTSRLFDASGMKTAQYKKAMKELGKSFAYGVSACRAEGHTLRTRAGHCIQCDTSKIAFQRRNDDEGFVYIAGSFTLKLIKIGMTNSTTDRLLSINAYGYGGTDDWELLAYLKTKNAGNVEFGTHNLLKQYSCPIQYNKGGKIVNCLELFSCGINTAKKAFVKAAHPKIILTPHGSDEMRLHSVFEFSDRLSDGAFRQGNLTKY